MDTSTPRKRVVGSKGVPGACASYAASIACSGVAIVQRNAGDSINNLIIITWVMPKPPVHTPREEFLRQFEALFAKTMDKYSLDRNVLRRHPCSTLTRRSHLPPQAEPGHEMTFERFCGSMKRASLGRPPAARSSPKGRSVGDRNTLRAAESLIREVVERAKSRDAQDRVRRRPSLTSAPPRCRGPRRRRRGADSASRLRRLERGGCRGRRGTRGNGPLSV